MNLGQMIIFRDLKHKFRQQWLIKIQMIHVLIQKYIKLECIKKIKKLKIIYNNKIVK